jgi:hypothetical protein
MTPEIAAELQREQGALDVAQAYAITGTPEEQNFLATEANKELRTVKARVTRLKEKAGFVAPAKQIIANAEALFDPAINANLAAEKYLKDQLTGYDGSASALAAEALRAREAEERRARQEADAKAAAERARAEEQAAARKRKLAEEAEAKRCRDRRGQQARESRRRRRREGEAGRAGSRRDRERRGEGHGSPVGRVAAPTTTCHARAAEARRILHARELGRRTRHRRERGRREARALPGDRRGPPDLLSLLALDMAAANRLAKAQKKNMNAPGLQAVNRPVAASRAA